MIKYTSTMGKSKGMKTVYCKKQCGNKMEISFDNTAGTCWRCVSKMMSGPLAELGYDYNENHNEADESDSDTTEDD